VAGNDGRIYALGGADASFNAVASVDAYDPSTNTWIGFAPMPTPRLGLAAAIDARGTLYAFGGFSFSGGTVQYPDTPAIYAAAPPAPSPAGWSAGAPMPTGREGLATVLGPDGLIYAFGGYHDTDGVPLATVEAYRPSATNLSAWSLVPPMPTARAFLGVATGGDGRIYTHWWNHGRHV